MKSLISAATISLAAVFAAPSSFAGYYEPTPVQIDRKNNHVAGDLYATRNTSDDVSYIGCGIFATGHDDGTAYVRGFCNAADSTGDHLECHTENPALIELMDSITTRSYVSFHYKKAADGTGYECTNIEIHTKSSTLESGPVAVR